MISNLLKKIAGRHYRKYIKNAWPVVKRIRVIEADYQKLTDDQIRAKTAEFKNRFTEGETLEELLPEAFATVMNTSRRHLGQTITVSDHEQVWDMVHFDVQLIGGMALNDNKIAEMATGEGKTLVATLPLYLNAISGRNCQLVTTNDFLALRDSEWMGYIYKFLGLTVGCIQNNMDPATRRAMYNCDVTYGTASEFGFDYLRDNGMATRKEDQVQRDHYYVIIDEVDSILVDEARTPLIISGPVQNEREMPFNELKSSIERLVKKQSTQCNNLVSEAEKIIKNGDESTVDGYEKLLQVKLANPKNKQFMRLMEDGNVRKNFEKFDLEMSGDFNKERLYALKEELFYVIDEKQRQADLTEKGRILLRPDNDDAFVLPDLPSIFMEIDKKDSLSKEDIDQEKANAQDTFEKRSEDIHCISQLLRAYSLYERDIEYLVSNGKVVIIDENTGRAMPGRRWSDGLHAAVEAKEGVTVELESKTFATITIQNYFRLYDKIAGMTGTAETEASEFNDIYKLNVMVIPPNKPNQRTDDHDIIYRTRNEKYNAVMRDIQKSNKKGQPVLVGTASVEASELLSRLLRRENITHNVLNAKQHEQEAEIVTRAGQRGVVTIATNMAGRGTDIKLGEGITDLGGLHVLGTERHQSRRTDRQLRGRCARQGDPGGSKFYISLEDDLLRLFGNSGYIAKLLEKSVGEGEVPLPSWVIENAQKRVEQQHYSVRKRLLQYDDVLNRQREVIYNLRNDAIHTETPKELIFELIGEEIESRMDEAGLFNPRQSDDSLDGFLHWLNTQFPVALKIEDVQEKEAEELQVFLLENIKTAYKAKELLENQEALQALERYVIIGAMDKHWQDHLTEMEELRQSVGLRGYGQKDPLNEYKNEAFLYFEQMMKSIRADVCHRLFHSATNIKAFENMLSVLSRQAQTQGPVDPTGAAAPGITGPSNVPRRRLLAGAGGPSEEEAQTSMAPVRNQGPKVGRNDPCPCGSGKKYKKCCGRVA